MSIDSLPAISSRCEHRSYLLSAVDVSIDKLYMLSALDLSIDKLPAISSRCEHRSYLLSAVDVSIDKVPAISSRCD